MSNVENSLSKILADAEAAVLKVLADAAAAGDYVGIDRSKILGEKLRDMNNGLDRRGGVAESSSGPSMPTKNIRKKKTTQKDKSDYPKFEFKRGSLFKFGWSKKRNDEYVHRVPVAAVNLVSHALQDFVGTTETVSSDQILESEVLSRSVPNYQVYVVLAFLKDRGVITSVGREGYQLPSNIESQVDDILHKEADQS